MIDLWNKRKLIQEFTLLEMKIRYKGSYLGIFWWLIHPILMLGIYIFIFQIILKPRWNFESGSDICPYILILFCGMIVFNLFGECLMRAPLLLVTHRNYVKKIVFPIEILPISIVGSALIHFFVSLGILLLGMLAWGKIPSLHLLLLPFILLPLILLSLGVSWFVTCLGVLLRDLTHIMPFLVQILFFLTPVIYPVEAIPPSVRAYFKLNILTVLVEDARNIILFGKAFPWGAWSVTLLISAGVCIAGYFFFMLSKKAYADFL